jgi:hypothetical protein
MEAVEDAKCRGRPWRLARCGQPPRAQKLDVVGLRRRAIAEIQAHFVNPMCVDDDEVIIDRALW